MGIFRNLPQKRLVSSYACSINLSIYLCDFKRKSLIVRLTLQKIKLGKNIENHQKIRYNFVQVLLHIIQEGKNWKDGKSDKAYCK